MTARLETEKFSERCAYHFEYGPDATYGSSTPETALGSGFDDLPATADLSGLESGRTYHFRVVATNAYGTTTSEDATFVTSFPPSINSAFVTDVDQDGATLWALINPNGTETSYQFEYGLTDAYGSVAPASPASMGSSSVKQMVGAPLAGLAPGTTYHYRVVACNPAGESSGRDHTFTTLSRPCEGDTCGGAPPPPAGGGGGSPVAPPAAPRKTPLKVSRLTRKNWARTGRLRLKVTVGGEGRVTARTSAKLPGRWEPSTVARDAKSAATAGVVTLTLRLSRAARRALADARLRVAIVVASTGSDDSPTLRATLKKRAAGG